MEQCNNSLLHATKIILASLALALFVAALASLGGFSADSARAAAGDDVNGYAWSDNIGWISFDDGNVNIDETTGAFSGYAWSDNIGWIDFTGPLAASESSRPESPDTGVVVDFTDGAVTGWTRACSVFQTGCSGSLKSATALGGWDGWIKMHNVTLDTVASPNTFSGFAWGDVVPGWIDMDGVTYGGTSVVVPVPSVTLSAPANVTQGTSFNIAATLTNLDGKTCTDGGSPEWWDDSFAIPDDSEQVSRTISGGITTETTYNLTCDSGPTDSIIVGVDPFFSKFEATPPSVFAGDGTVLSWETQNIDSGTCTGSSTPIDSSWNNGGKPLSCTASNCGQVTPVASAGTNQTYTLVCQGVSKSISVPVKYSGFWLGADSNEMDITIIGEGTTITGGVSDKALLAVHPDLTFVASGRSVVLSIYSDPFSGDPGSGYGYKFQIVEMSDDDSDGIYTKKAIQPAGLPAGSIPSGVGTFTINPAYFWNHSYGIEFWLESTVELPARTRNKITIKGIASGGTATDFLDLFLDSRAFNPKYKEI